MPACSYCGTRLTASTTFCPHCGQERAGMRRTLLTEPPPKPNFTDRMQLQGGNAARLMVALLATLVGSGVFVGLFFADDTRGLLIASIALAVATTLCALPEARELRQLFASERMSRLKPWLLAAVITPLLPLLADAWLRLIGVEGENQVYLDDLSPGMALLTLCIFPGIFEELAFRGVVFGNLRHMLRPRYAHLLTAALFAGMHFSPAIFPYHLLVGLYLGFLRERSGTLVVPMFAHGLHNAMVVFFFEFS